jgi:chaperonin cofactor prefoldin
MVDQVPDDVRISRLMFQQSNLKTAAKRVEQQITGVRAHLAEHTSARADVALTALEERRDQLKAALEHVDGQIATIHRQHGDSKWSPQAAAMLGHLNSGCGLR